MSINLETWKHFQSVAVVSLVLNIVSQVSTGSRATPDWLNCYLIENLLVIDLFTNSPIEPKVKDLFTNSPIEPKVKDLITNSPIDQKV